VAHRQLEVPLNKKEQIAPKAFQLARDALVLARQDAQSPHIPEAALREVHAEIANVEGILAECEARSTEDTEERQSKAGEAEKNYRQALEYKRDWIPAKSNLARIYQRLLGQPAPAETLWNEVLRIRPGDAYANYMLGELFEQAEPPRIARAFECYWRAASDIKKAQVRLKALEKQVPTYQRPIDYAPPWRPATPEAGSKD
jgi:tetratricopeptide (TPR) repeat protein